MSYRENPGTTLSAASTTIRNSASVLPLRLRTNIKPFGDLIHGVLRAIGARNGWGKTIRGLFRFWGKAGPVA